MMNEMAMIGARTGFLHDTLRQWGCLLVFAAMTLAAPAQSSILLNINSSTYPTPISVTNFQAMGVPGLSGGELISQIAPAFNVGLISPNTFTNRGPVMFMDTTANGGTYVKSTGAGSSNGLMDCYFYTTTTTPRTLTVSNLNLTPGTNYTLYLIGTIPVSGVTEDGLFQPVNTPNILFSSTATGHGLLSVPFTTSAAYSNANVLRFTWAKSSTGNGSFQGLAILPGAAAPTQNLSITNGIQKYAALTNTIVGMSGHSELWVTSSFIPLSGCTIQLNSADSWLVLPNVKPSLVIASTYLHQIRINGSPAEADINVRVVQFGQSGSIVIPHSSSFQPLTAYSQSQFRGTATPYSQSAYYKGNGYTNMGSFRLKRGYQAVLARSTDGTGTSRCYVAQDGDLEVGVLPDGLDQQVRFIYVTPWRWTTKKGSCDIWPSDVTASWWYNWNINQSSPADMQYVAIRQQPYWPGLGQDWRSLGVNHLLGYNEPNNSVEDAYKNLNPPGSVSDTVARWPEMLATGLRVGAPAVTDGGYSWIVDFVNQAEAAGHRIDYVPVHYYRSYPNNDYPQGAANNLYNYLKSIHDVVKRPIWVTEFNNGANWTADADPTFDQNRNVVEAMINMMDGTPWIERYAIYSAVEEVRQVYYNAGGLTPMGLMYRNHAAPPAYAQGMPDNGARGIAEFLFATNTWDTSGHCNNAMAIGSPAFGIGHNSQSQAIVLDGANSYLQLPANMARGSGFTFAAWVYWSGGGNWQRIFDFGNDTSQYLYLTPSSGGGTLRFAINSGSGEQIVERAAALPSGSWQHVAITLGGNIATLYLNGAQVASSSAFSILPSAFSPARNFLGKSQFSADPLFNGKLDAVEITDFAMTTNQISALYRSTQYPIYSGGVWTNMTDSVWTSTSNWSGGCVANGNGFIADFSTLDITSDRTVMLDSARTVGGLKFGDVAGAQNWTLSGAPPLTLDGGTGYAPTITVTRNTATLTTTLTGSNGFIKRGDGTLTLAGTNLLGGGLIVSGGSVSVAGGTTTFGSGTSTVGYLTGAGHLNVTGGNLAIGGELRIGGSDQSGPLFNAAGTANLSNTMMSVGSLSIARGNYRDNSVSGTVTLNSGSSLVSTNDVVLQFAGSGIGRLIMNGGNLVIGPGASKWLMIGYWDSGGGELSITNGNILLENSTSIKMCRSGNTGGNVVNQSGGAVTFFRDGGVTPGGTGNLDLNYAGGVFSSSIYNLNGGTLTVPQIIASSAAGTGILNFNGGRLQPTASNGSFISGLTRANVRNGGALIDTAGWTITIGQPLEHSNISGDAATDGGLTKTSPGILTLTGRNTYTGPTTISSGTLVLNGGGSFSNSASINLGTGTSFNVSGVAFTLGASQSLRGNGLVNGAAVIKGTIAPGAPVGTLTFSTPPLLQGNLMLELNRTNSPNSDRILVISGTLNYNGILTVVNAGPPLHGGDSFKLVQAGSTTGSFTSLNLPQLGASLTWDTSNLGSGILRVVETTPPTLSWGFNGTNLNLSWPAESTGWRLLVQANPPHEGIGSNWVEVPGGSMTNSVEMPADPTQGSMFYKLMFP